MQLATSAKIIGIFIATTVVLLVSLSCAIYGCAWAVHRWSFTGGWWLGAFSVVIFVPLVGLYVFTLRRLIQNRWQVSMKGLVVGIASFALLFAVTGHVYRNQVHRQSVIYKFWLAEGQVVPNPRHTRNFLCHAIGFDPFQEVQTVWVRNSEALVVIAENPKVFHNLQEIIIQGKIDYRETACLNEISSLKTAVIESFGPIDVEALVTWTNLESIRFFSCQSFIGADADAEVKSLSKLKHLKGLELWQADVSDEGLLSLTELRNLDRLSVVQTKVTASGLAAFASALPDCHVVSDVLTK